MVRILWCALIFGSTGGHTFDLEKKFDPDYGDIFRVNRIVDHATNHLAGHTKSMPPVVLSLGQAQKNQTSIIDVLVNGSWIERHEKKLSAAFDISSYLRPGENVIQLIAAAGSLVGFNGEGSVSFKVYIDSYGVNHAKISRKVLLKSTEVSVFSRTVEVEIKS